MSSSKPGRNDPCPCGSGKKYKKCCLSAVEQAKTSELRQKRQEGVIDSLKGQIEAEVYAEGARIAELSNKALTLLEEKRFEEALSIGKELMDGYPDLVNGYELSAIARAGRGDYAEAVGLYRRALELSERPEQRELYDDEVRADFRRKIEELSVNA